MTMLLAQGAAVTVSASAAALAWTNAFIATSQDDSRTVLYRTLALEFFPTGLQCIACDGFALFRCWAPAEDGTPWPMLHEMPDHSATVLDINGFGLGFMRLVLAATKDLPHQALSLEVGRHAADEQPALGEDFVASRLTLRGVGQRIDLPLVDGTYPNWRRAQYGLASEERVPGMTFSPRLMALVGKLKGVTRVDLEFAGENKGVTFAAAGKGGIDVVRGVLMPMRRLGKSSEA